MLNKITKIITMLAFVLIVFGGLYYWKIQDSSAPTLTNSNSLNDILVTPEELLVTGIKRDPDPGVRGNLKKDQVFRDTNLGYEFVLPSDLYYQYYENEGSGVISLFAHYDDTLGSFIPTAEWPSVTVSAVAQLPAMYDLMDEVNIFYSQLKQNGQNPKIVECKINEIPCIKIELRSGLHEVQHGDIIYFASKSRMLLINFDEVNTQEAKDYYQQFLSGFKIIE